MALRHTLSRLGARAVPAYSAFRGGMPIGQAFPAPLIHVPLIRGFSASSSPISDAAASNLPAPHPGMKALQHADYMLMHPVYSPEQLDIKLSHRPPASIRDHVALILVTAARRGFDLATGYKADSALGSDRWLQRFIFLETVAAIPGMVGGALRHLESLRLLRRDNGWIITLMEEAENERMHLLTFIKLKQPGLAFRAAIIVTQGIVYNAFFLSYILSPKTCHRFVGYLEEEAVRTYTHAIHDLDQGHIPEWSSMPAPEIAMDYWKLPKGAMMRDVLMAVRADEACHSHVNHTLSTISHDDPNPFRGHKGHTILPKSFVDLPEGVKA